MPNRGITPKTQVYQSNCDHNLYCFKQEITVLMHLVNNRICAPLYELWSFQRLCCLTLLPYMFSW